MPSGWEGAGGGVGASVQCEADTDCTTSRVTYAAIRTLTQQPTPNHHLHTNPPSSYFRHLYARDTHLGRRDLQPHDVMSVARLTTCVCVRGGNGRAPALPRAWRRWRACNSAPAPQQLRVCTRRYDGSARHGAGIPSRNRTCQSVAAGGGVTHTVQTKSSCVALGHTLHPDRGTEQHVSRLTGSASRAVVISGGG